MGLVSRTLLENRVSNLWESLPQDCPHFSTAFQFWLSWTLFSRELVSRTQSERRRLGESMPEPSVCLVGDLLHLQQLLIVDNSFSSVTSQGAAFLSVDTASQSMSFSARWQGGEVKPGWQDFTPLGTVLTRLTYLLFYILPRSAWLTP